MFGHVHKAKSYLAYGRCVHGQEAPERRRGYMSKMVLGKEARERVLSALSSKACTPAANSGGEQEERMRLQARSRQLREIESLISDKRGQIEALHQQRLQALQAFLVFFNFLHGDAKGSNIPALAGCEADIRRLHHHVQTVLDVNDDVLDDLRQQTGPGSVLASMLDATVSHQATHNTLRSTNTTHLNIS